jgi:ferric iron reductase protein FhuF
MCPSDSIQAGRLVRIYNELRLLHPDWYVEFGRRSGNGWIPGDALLRPNVPPFSNLLARIGERLMTTDRKVIAASFALRFGWSAAAAVAPYLLKQCVPDLSLDNVSLRFSMHTFFEKLSLHDSDAVVLDDSSRDNAGESGPGPALQAALRNTLVAQATPVVSALHEWSQFSARAIWGQIASSWGAQFTAILGHLDRHAEALEQARTFFDTPGFIRGMSPRFYPVMHCNVSRIYHRRASCCLYFRLPTGNYCASCPLIPQAESVRRNKEWIEKTVARTAVED